MTFNKKETAHEKDLFSHLIFNKKLNCYIPMRLLNGNCWNQLPDQYDIYFYCIIVK